jgi:hypothetical protein
METMAIVGVYAVMGAAILAGLVLLWHMIVELMRFDSQANRPRSARVSALERRANRPPQAYAIGGKAPITSTSATSSDARPRIRIAG